jgi:hypothetical protein
MIRLDPDKDLCPCDSGKLLRVCCLGPDNTFKTTPSVTRPSGSKTGFANPRCYAARLEDCSQALSREHFITHAILKALSHSGVVKVDGFNWQAENTSQELPTPVLASRILCKRHNEGLSGLDAVALRLFRTIDDAIREKVHRDQVSLFDGSDFERWLMKTLCGAAFSGNAHRGAVSRDWSPSSQWLRILFDGAQFPERCGFYFAGDSAETIEGGFKLRTISNLEDGLYGVRISFDDEFFLFLMDAPPEDLRGTYLERYLYRPKEIVLLNGNCETVIRFVWNDRFQHRTRVIKYEKSERFFPER